MKDDLSQKKKKKKKNGNLVFSSNVVEWLSFQK